MNLGKNEKETLKKFGFDENENYNKVIESAKNVNVNLIKEKFNDYFDFNITTYSNTKFDVILFLYQKNYICSNDE